MKTAKPIALLKLLLLGPLLGLLPLQSIALDSDRDQPIEVEDHCYLNLYLVMLMN